MSYSHRTAHLDDLPAIVAIYNSTVASRQVTADIELVTVSSRHAWFAEHLPDQRPLWVVEEENENSGARIIGWLSYSNYYGRAAYSGTAELSIYIHEAARGKGVGRYLLTQAIAFAPQLSLHTLLGFIFGCNTPSLKLFEECGFESWGKLPRVANLDGIEHDVIIVGKRVA